MLAFFHHERDSHEPRPVCLLPWQENPHRLVSWWDVVTLLATEIVSIWPSLTELSWGSDMDGEHAASLAESRARLDAVIRVCQKLKWKDLERQAERLLARAEKGERGEAMVALAEDLRDGVKAKLRGLLMVGIEEHDVRLFTDGSRFLCGGELAVVMASSEEEMNLAGRALALGLGTAAVSHAMRSVEASLHALCRTLEITFPGTIELQGWKNLTDKIKCEIDILERQSGSPQRTAQLKRLSELMVSADGFRLAWRNHVAHAREKYEESEARPILGHVGEFLRRLSAAL